MFVCRDGSGQISQGHDPGTDQWEAEKHWSCQTGGHDSWHNPGTGIPLLTVDR